MISFLQQVVWNLYKIMIVLFDQIRNILKPNGQFWLTLQVDQGNGAEHVFDTVLNVYTQEKAQNILIKNHFRILDFEINACIYKSSKTQAPAMYFMIIAEKI